MALPVQTPKVYAETLRAPRIAKVWSQDTTTGPVLTGAPILAGHRLVLRGTHLRGDRTLVRIGSAVTVPDPGSVTDAQITVPIPATTPAGVQSAQVIHERMLGQPPAGHTGVVSNLAAFVLRPTIVHAAFDASTVLTLDIDPALVGGQRAVVFLNELQAIGAPADPPPRAYSFPVPPQSNGSPPGPAFRIHVKTSGVQPGRYLVRLQVEGAESPVHQDPQGRYERPAVTVP